MKRAAPNNLTAISLISKESRHSRNTRSAQRKADQEQHEKSVRQAKKFKAEALMSSPLLQALPLVLSSGFLYKWECYSPALVNKEFHSIWVEAQHDLPEEFTVEIRVDQGRRVQGEWPVWVTRKGMEDILPTYRFARTVFENLCDLKVAVETTERKKQKVRFVAPHVSVSVCSFAWT